MWAFKNSVVKLICYGNVQRKILVSNHFITSSCPSMRNLGHMEEVTEIEEPKIVFYYPHHAILQQNCELCLIDHV